MLSKPLPALESDGLRFADWLLGARTLLGAPGIATRSKDATIGAPGIATRSKDATIGAPGIATRSKDATIGAPGIATRSKDATRCSWHR